MLTTIWTLAFGAAALNLTGHDDHRDACTRGCPALTRVWEPPIDDAEKDAMDLASPEPGEETDPSRNGNLPDMDLLLPDPDAHETARNSESPPAAQEPGFGSRTEVSLDALLPEFDLRDSNDAPEGMSPQAPR